MTEYSNINVKADAYRQLGLAQDEEIALDRFFDAVVQVNGLDKTENPLIGQYKTSFAMLEGINTFLQKYALRAGERTDIKPAAIDADSLAELKTVFTKLGMVDEVTPSLPVYDAVLCMGAAEAGVRPRINQLAEIIQDGKPTVKNIVVLGSARKLWPLKKTDAGNVFPEPIVYDILAARISERDGKVISSQEVKQAVLNMDTKETAVEKLSEEVSSNPYFRGIEWPTETDLIKAVIKENPVFDGQKLVVVRTPDFPNGKRADSSRTIEWAVKENPDILHAKADVLLISSQPFTRNQKTVAKQSLPKDAKAEAIAEGISDFTPKQAMICMDSLARTVYAVFAKVKEKEAVKTAMLGNVLGRRLS